MSVEWGNGASLVVHFLCNTFFGQARPAEGRSDGQRKCQNPIKRRKSLIMRQHLKMKYELYNINLNLEGLPFKKDEKLLI